jgi:hypothetical protein
MASILQPKVYYFEGDYLKISHNVNLDSTKKERIIFTEYK